MLRTRAVLGEIGSDVPYKNPVKRKAAMVKAVKKRRLRVKEMAVEFMGGKCQICGYNKCQDTLEFHRLNNDEKSFGISAKGYTRSWKAIQEELDKCIMLCANCHRELHAGLIEIDNKLFFDYRIKKHSGVAQPVRATDCHLAAPFENEGM